MTVVPACRLNYRNGPLTASSSRENRSHVRISLVFLLEGAIERTGQANDDVFRLFSGYSSEYSGRFVSPASANDICKGSQTIMEFHV